MRILGYSWVGIRTEDYQTTVRFFRDTLGLPVEWLREDAEVAGFRLPSGQLLEVFGPNDAGVQTTNCPVVGFEVEDVAATREELARVGVEFITDVTEGSAGDAWVYFRGPDAQLYELQRPATQYQMRLP